MMTESGNDSSLDDQNDSVLGRDADGARASVTPRHSGPNSTSAITANIADIAAVDASSLACNALPAGSMQGSIALVLRGTCTFETKINNVANAGAVAALIYAAPTSPDPIPIAAGAATLPASMVSYQTGASLKQQIASGAVTATLNFQLKPVMVDPSKISSYSSLGPNSDAGVKPDLIAAGDYITPQSGAAPARQRDRKLQTHRRLRLVWPGKIERDVIALLSSNWHTIQDLSEVFVG